MMHVNYKAHKLSAAATSTQISSTKPHSQTQKPYNPTADFPNLTGAEALKLPVIVSKKAAAAIFAGKHRVEHGKTNIQEAAKLIRNSLANAAHLVAVFCAAIPAKGTTQLAAAILNGLGRQIKERQRITEQDDRWESNDSTLERDDATFLNARKGFDFGAFGAAT